MFLYSDVSSQVLIVVVHLRRFLVQLGELRLDRHVLRHGALGRVRHRRVRRPAELLCHLVHSLHHLLFHPTVKHTGQSGGGTLHCLINMVVVVVVVCI